MPNWGASMQQTFEYYTVDPGIWQDDQRITTITKSTIERDSDSETLGSASIEATESLGECYVRIYLITIQNGKREKHPLGTFLVQTPSTSFDGKVKKITMDAYTPLLELKENPPPLGYSIFKNENIMDNAYLICREHMRAPVVKTTNSEKLYSDFVANTDDTWLTFVSDLIANAKYSFGLDELSRLIFVPDQDIESLQPVWTYDDGNSSILYPDISMDHDLYGVPNIVEVVYSGNGANYTPPSVSAGQYLWTKTVFTYTNGGTATQYSVAKQGATGAAGADALTGTITLSNGNILKNNTGSTVLTAHVWKGSVEQTITDAGVCGSLGSVKWYKVGSDTAIATAKSITVSAGDVTNTASYYFKLEG